MKEEGGRINKKKCEHRTFNIERPTSKEYAVSSLCHFATFHFGTSSNIDNHFGQPVGFVLENFQLVIRDGFDFMLHFVPRGVDRLAAAEGGESRGVCMQLDMWKQKV